MRNARTLIPLVLSLFAGAAYAQADIEMQSADLIHTQIDGSVRVGDVGEPARFRLQIKNHGNQPTGPFHVAMVLSKNSQLNLNVDQMFATSPVASIPANGTSTVVFTAPLPTQLRGEPVTTGDYYLIGIADWFNVIPMGVGYPRDALVKGAVLMREPAPDYRFTRLKTPPNAAGGEQLQVELGLRNAGTQDGKEVAYACFASINDIITPGDFALPFVTDSGELAPTKVVTLARGEMMERVEAVQVPGNIPAGNYYVGCVVDPHNTVLELEEGNNARATVSPIPFTGQSFQLMEQTLPDATVGLAYGVQLSTVSAPGPVTFETQAVAPGLALGADGRVTGNPTALGQFTFTARARSGAFAAERVFSVRVAEPSGELTIVTSGLPTVLNSTQMPYSTQLAATGGAKPYTWSLLSGTLPNGLTLSAAGLLSGTPKPGVANGEYPLTVQVRGPFGSPVSRQLRLRVTPPGALVVESHSLSSALVGHSYLESLSASMTLNMQIAGPLQWRLGSGALPPGLSLSSHQNGTHGVLSGTPTQSGAFTFGVEAVDNIGRIGKRDFVMLVHPSLVTVNFAQAPGPLSHGDEVDLPLAVSTGAAATWRLHSGALPEGLSLTADGRITGTVAEEARSGLWSFTVRAQTASGQAGVGSLALEVLEPPVTDVGCSASGAGASGGTLGLVLLGGTLGLGLLRRRRSA